MKSMIAALLSLGLTALPAPAQEDGSHLYPVRIDKKWGYIDARGVVVIPPKFDSAGDFSDGLANASIGVVERDGARDRRDEIEGFIDPAGAWAIEPVYETADAFHEGLAGVRLDGRHGFIDTTGERVIATTWSGRVGGFHDARAFVELGRDRLGYLDRGGRLAFVVDGADVSGPGNFSEGVVRIETTDGDIRYLDVDGNLVLDPEVDFGREFSEGLCAVRVGKAWGFIDETGAFAIEPNLSFASSFHEGLAIVSTKEKGKHYIDREGREVLDCSAFERLSNFHEGLARVESKATGKFGYIDRTGKLVIEAKWENPQSSQSGFRGGIALVADTIGGKRARCFIDRTGEVVWSSLDPYAKTEAAKESATDD